MAQFVILGAGYTGSRVVRLLMDRGERVLATNRSGLGGAMLDIERPETIARLQSLIEPGARILHSVPVLRTANGWLRPTPLLLPLIQKAARVVYLSTTGVYGAAERVDGSTPTAARMPRESLRVEEERDVLAACANALILRPAAIYGPDRGVHVSMREGKHRVWGDGSNYISRIHVDDLAAIAEAALRSRLTGAFPVADDEPARSRDIAAYCAQLLDLPIPAPTGDLPREDTRASNRQVDGRAIRHALGVVEVRGGRLE